VIVDAWLRVLAAAADGSRRWTDALRIAGDAETLLAMSAAELRQTGLNAADRERLANSAASLPAAWPAWLDAAGHELIVYGSPRYPRRLMEIPDAPLALWADGKQPDLLAQAQLAVVGSRNPTRNGQTVAEDLAREAGALGIAITSGLALGIDAASHRGALASAGGTIAVSGCGIDRVYPGANARLARDICRQGLIVSEYGPGHGIRPVQFPRRNRIIAALSLGTLVVEATRRSGSLITARLAAEYGREVFAVPGSIHSALSKGCHKLLRDGAKLVETVDDILVEIAPQLVPLTRDSAVITAAELPEVLRNRLDFSPVAFDALVSATGLTAGELSSMLLHLELQGKIEALPGGRYCRLAKRA
jgi:DNA processing protein